MALPPHGADEYPTLPCQMDPERWFVEGTSKTARRLIASAIQGCRTCPALAACLVEAEKVKPTFGVWAGRYYNSRRLHISRPEREAKG